MPGIRAVRRCRTQLSRVKAAKVLSKSAHVKILCGFCFFDRPIFGLQFERGPPGSEEGKKEGRVCVAAPRANGSRVAGLVHLLLTASAFRAESSYTNASRARQEVVSDADAWSVVSDPDACLVGRFASVVT